MKKPVRPKKPKVIRQWRCAICGCDVPNAEVEFIIGGSPVCAPDYVKWRREYPKGRDQ